MSLGSFRTTTTPEPCIVCEQPSKYIHFDFGQPLHPDCEPEAWHLIREVIS